MKEKMKNVRSMDKTFVGTEESVMQKLQENACAGASF